MQGPYTFNINSTIIVGSNTILTGDSTATIKLKNNANWSASISLISSTTSAHDITIYGFKVDGNREGNTNIISGQNYYNIFGFTNVNNLDIHNVNLTNNYNDGLNLKFCTNVKYHDNILYLLGHDGLYACNSNFVEAYNNVITCRTNSGLRAYNSNHISFHDNTITSQGSGSAGIEIQKFGNSGPMNDVNLYNNNIHDTAYPGIWVFGSGLYPTADTYLHIYNNYIFKTGNKQINITCGGILSDGFNGLIENNIIDFTYGSGIAQANIYQDLPKISGFTLILNNNTVTNVKAGYGINNALNTTHNMTLQNNHLSNNLPGDYFNVTPDIIINPSPVKTLPIANFSVSNNTGYVPLKVQFKDNSSNATLWKWDFGDGTNSTDQSPAHTYFTAGTYTVNLTVSNANGTSSKTTVISVNFTPVVPVAQFSSNVTIGDAPLSVQFTDLSQYATAWNWNFGDKSSSTSKNPSHKYTKAGNYTVTLTAGNTNGSSNISKMIVITTLQKPKAAFSVSNTSGKAPLAIKFTDNSTGIINSWSWNFGDKSSSTLQNPTHVYAKTGKYTVSLTVKNTAGSNVITKSNCIIVITPPIAAFSASLTSGKSPLTVKFTDKSTGSPTSWYWDFGDKTTSTVQNPIHKYTKAGKYTVILKVNNSAGSNTAKKTSYIIVK